MATTQPQSQPQQGGASTPSQQQGQTSQQGQPSQQQGGSPIIRDWASI